MAGVPPAVLTLHTHHSLGTISEVRGKKSKTTDVSSLYFALNAQKLNSVVKSQHLGQNRGHTQAVQRHTVLVPGTAPACTRPPAVPRPPITCLTILLLSRPYMRSKDPQFLTCGCSSCRIF